MVNIVKVMPGTHLLLSANTVEDGVVRLFRGWLKEQERTHGLSRDEENHDPEYNAAGGSDRSQSHLPMLWVDQGENVGLKVRVRQKKDSDAVVPVLVHRDEEVLTSYEVDIEGMFFLQLSRESEANHHLA